jgi:hypothetical protein
MNRNNYKSWYRDIQFDDLSTSSSRIGRDTVETGVRDSGVSLMSIDEPRIDIAPTVRKPL